MSISTFLRWTDPLFDLRRLYRFSPNVLRFFRDYRQYRRVGGAVPWRDMWPIFSDWTRSTQFDAHYTYLNVWAFRKITAAPHPVHVDIGSQTGFVTLLSVIKEVTFIDIRPLEIDLSNLRNQTGSVLNLPFSDRSQMSLSTLHVIEHIGLGRYGDPIDPQGTAKAIVELARVLAPGGDLFVALPTGQTRTCFNAHRIVAPTEIVHAFENEGLQLKDFCIVNDQSKFLENVNPGDFDLQRYACGMFHFFRPGSMS